MRKLEEVEIDRQSLAAELQLWKEKALESQDKMKIIASDEEKKAAFMIENEVAAMRRGFIEAEADYKFQLARLNKQVSERSSL